MKWHLLMLPIVLGGSSYLFLGCMPAAAEEPAVTVAEFLVKEEAARSQAIVDKVTPSPLKLASENETKPIDAESIDPDSIDIEVIGQQEKLTFPSTSAPVYVLPAQEIERQGSRNAAEALRGLPGFAVQDAGFGADIHTGTFYRGASINQSIFLIDGRNIGSNINTYHGGTDLNSLPLEVIERIELLSGTAATLYGSEALGGVVNFITKREALKTTISGQFQLGSYGNDNRRLSVASSVDNVSYRLGYEENLARNRYPVPVGAANRDSDGFLFNGDTATTSYNGNLSVRLNPNDTLSFDAYKVSSRRGLLYFGFPLQNDRLDHDLTNLGLIWKSKLDGTDNSILTTSVAFNQDYFSTYGPAQNTFYRQGILDSRSLSGRVEHQWQTAANNKLTWGLDVKNNWINGNTFSTRPEFAGQNEIENRDRFNLALFALNAWRVNDALQLELGLRQNITSDFGSYLNPTAGVRYALSSAIALRGSYASVQRNPGLDQLYVFDTVHNWLPNPNLQPETGSAWTAGLDVEFAPGLTGQFTYFGNSLSNRLGIIAGKWENIGLVNTNGLEAALRWQISLEFSTFLNYTYTNARVETGADRGLQLSTVPFSVGQLGFGYASEGWGLNLYASYNSGARRALFAQSGVNATEFAPSYLSLDASARIPLLRGVTMLIYLENLADVPYERVNRIFSPGLTYRLAIQSKF
jgi:vitamin B12 transporter